MGGGMKHHKLLSALFFIILISTPLYPYKKIKCFILQPPERLLQGVKKVAILDFEGPRNYGRYLADNFIQELMRDNRGIGKISDGFLGTGNREGKTFLTGATTRIYSIVERSTLETIIKEQSLGMTGLVDANQAAAVGKVLGVDAIITGNYTLQTSETPSSEERTNVLSKNKETKIVSCLTRKATVTASMRIVGVETAQILDTYTASGTREDKKCDPDLGKIMTPDAIVQAAMSDIANGFTNHINPYFAKIEIELKKIKAKEFEKIAEMGAEAAEDNDIDKAFQCYYSIYEKDPYNPELQFNLAAIHEVVGNFGEAKDLYESALALDNSDDNQKGFKRAQNSMTLVQSLAAIDINIQKHDFNSSAAMVSEITADRVKIKGGREDRVAIYTTPDAGSTLVAKVPGGITVKVVEKKANWILIELPGGKQGYIEQKSVEK